MVFNWIYPPLCCHCEERLEKKNKLLCLSCAELCVLADPSDRCRYCFSPSSQRSGVCYRCAGQSVTYRQAAFACEREGPARTLLSQFQQGSSGLADTLASFMTLQLLALNWSFPDLLVPLPSPLIHNLKRGYDTRLLLAQSLAKTLERPVVSLLKRSWIQENTFLLKKKARATDTRLLLIMDSLNREEATFAAATLQESFPLEIALIAFC